jgi:hypothetical protein
MSVTSRQWKRVAQVIIGRSGSGLLVQNLRVQFEIVKTLEPSPNTALIKIFNLHPNNETQIKNEFDEVLLNVGYQDSVRLAFRGNIKHVFRYRDKNDYITEIEAGDGDKDYRNAIMNHTLAAGTTNEHLIDMAIGTFDTTTKGYVNLSSTPRIRGRVISGNTRDILSDLAADTGANWSIQDGQLVMVNTDAVMPGEAIVINAETGMLNAPEINDKGIAVKCLLNPQIRVNGAIKLNNNDIKEKELRTKMTSGKERHSKEKQPVRLDPDGIYKIIKLAHRGDTRGAEWSTELACVGLSAPIPTNETATGEEYGA